MTYFTTRPGWSVETTHPVDAPVENEPVCSNCSDMIDPAIAFAVDWAFTGFQAQATDSEDVVHTVVVRAAE